MIDKQTFETALLHNQMTDLFKELVSTPQGREDIKETLGDNFMKVVNFGDQNNPWHCYTLLEHSTRVADLVDTWDWLDEKEKLKLKLIGLLHDIGKPDTASLNKKGYNNFIGHPEKGTQLALEPLNKLNLEYDLNFNFKEFDEMLWLIRNHDLFLNIQTQIQAEDKMLVAKTLLKAKENYPNYVPTRDDYLKLLAIATADALGHAEKVVVPDKDGNLIKKPEAGREPWAKRIDTIKGNLDEEIYLMVFETENKREFNSYYSNLENCIEIQLDNLYKRNENNLTQKEVNEFTKNVEKLSMSYQEIDETLQPQHFEYLRKIRNDLQKVVVLKEFSKNKDLPEETRELASMQAQKKLVEARKKIDVYSEDRCPQYYKENR